MRDVVVRDSAWVVESRKIKIERNAWANLTRRVPMCTSCSTAEQIRVHTCSDGALFRTDIEVADVRAITRLGRERELVFWRDNATLKAQIQRQGDKNSAPVARVRG